MSVVRRNALVRHSAERMFALVNDVAAYPRRFNWCEGSAVLEQSKRHMLARLDLALAGLRLSFTTRNTLDAPSRIDLALVDGPFRHFTGSWRFDRLADDACRVELVLDFDVAGRLVGSALAIGFTSLADRMVDDFCREANRDVPDVP